MGRLKATRIATPRIVQPGERARPWLWILLLLALGAWSWQVFQFGQKRAGFDSGARDAVEGRLYQRIAELEDERDRLRAEAARHERSGQIDRAAAEDVRSEVQALQQERADLKRQVAFLKTLVSGGGDSELGLGQHSLVALGEDRYRFEVTLSKRSADAKTVTGQVMLTVSGEVDGKPKTLDMQALTGGKRSNIGIRFKNFQKLKSELKLPKGFVPAAIEVAVKPEGKGFKAFEQTYDWKASDA
jgi:hypothetical protein